MPLLPDIMRPGYNPGPKGDDFFETRLGRDVYNRQSMTLKNRSPIDDLVSLIVSTASFGDGVVPAISATEMAKALLIDGSLVIHDSHSTPSQSPVFMPDVYCPSPGLIIQYSRGKGGALTLTARNNDMEQVHTKPMRELRLKNGIWESWLVTIEETGSSEDVRESNENALGKMFPDGLPEDKVPDAQYTIPEDHLLVHPNGRGILYYTQYAYYRVEEIALTVRRMMKGINLLPIIGGLFKPSEVSEAIMAAVNAIFLPGPFQIDRVISEAVVRQLVLESQERSRDLLDALNVVEKDTPDRPVARDRELRMRVMLQFVHAVRDQMKTLYDKLGTPITFSRIVVTGAQERLQELDLYDRLLGGHVITPEEYKYRAAALIG